MKVDNLVFFNEHQFDTLRKHMIPFYAELRFEESKPVPFKIEFGRNMIAKFFTRVRLYRNLSLEKISKVSGVSLEEVENFEQGKPTKEAKHLENHYIELCDAERELGYFFELLEEFMNPENRETKKIIAKNFSQITGLKFQTIRYDMLDSDEKNIIPFIIKQT